MLQREINDLKEWAEFDRGEIPHTKTSQREADLKARAERRETHASGHILEQAEVSDTICVLENCENKIRLRMLVP